MHCKREFTIKVAHLFCKRDICTQFLHKRNIYTHPLCTNIRTPTFYIDYPQTKTGLLKTDRQSTTLQCVAVCCSMLQCVAVCCSVIQCVAACCSVLQCVAMCCSVLQGVARCCNMMPLDCSALQCVAVCCSVLQFIAVCCSALQCVAVRRSAL